MRKIILTTCVALGAIFSSSPAFATTLVDGKIAGSGGFWFADYNKGYTFINNREGAVPLTSLTALDRTVFGTSTPTSVYLTWMTAAGSTNEREVTNATVTFYRGTELLLGLSAIPNTGHVSMIPGIGARADFSLDGLFSAVSGSLASLIHSPLDVSINYNIGIVHKGVDFHFTDGSIKVERTSESEPVPEPASAVLLLSSLIGLKARNRKARISDSI